MPFLETIRNSLESPQAVLLVVLAAAAAVSLAARPLRLGPIPGYIIAGVLIGPGVLGLVGESEAVHAISELAMVLLLFGLGLHLDLAGLKGGVGSILGVGVVSTAVVAAVLWPIGAALGLPWPTALAAALALSMSSTAVGLRLLQERREMHTMHGRVALGVLIAQDLLALAVLAVLPVIGAWAGAGPEGRPRSLADLAGDGALAVGGLAALLVVGKLVLPRLMLRAARAGSDELLLVLSAAVALLAAGLATALGFSAEFGAFLAGFLLSSTPFRHHVAGQLEPMRNLFMAVFFTAVGLELRPALLADEWGMILAALAALTIVKLLVVAATTWAFGATAPTSHLSAFTLANAGEFSLVVLTAAAAEGAVAADDRGRLIAPVVLSLALAPSLVKLGHATVRWVRSAPPAPWLRRSSLRGRAGEPAPAPPDPGDAPPAVPAEAGLVIIAGFGVVGRALADRFGIAGRPFTVVELNPETVRRQRALGRRVVYGDISNPEVLESAGLPSADAVVLTIPDEEATLRACRTIRALAPEVFIAARSPYLSHAMRAANLGADCVVVEEVATAEAMERQVLDRLRERAEARGSA